MGGRALIVGGDSLGGGGLNGGGGRSSSGRGGLLERRSVCGLDPGLGGIATGGLTLFSKTGRVEGEGGLLLLFGNESFLEGGAGFGLGARGGELAGPGLGLGVGFGLGFTTGFKGGLGSSLIGIIGAEGFDATGGGERGVSSSMSLKLIERLFFMNSGSSSSLALVFDSFRTIEDLFGPPLFFSNCHGASFSPSSSSFFDFSKSSNLFVFIVCLLRNISFMSNPPLVLTGGGGACLISFFGFPFFLSC